MVQLDEADAPTALSLLAGRGLPPLAAGAANRHPSVPADCLPPAPRPSPHPHPIHSPLSVAHTTAQAPLEGPGTANLVLLED